MTKLTDKNSILENLLDTAEVFHYATKFRDKSVLIALADINYLDELWEDLKILNLAQIKITLLIREVTGIKSLAKQLEKLGVPLITTFMKNENDKILKKKNKISLAVIKKNEKMRNLGFWQFGFNLVKKLKVSKYFITSNYEGICIGDHFKQTLNLNEIKEYLEHPHDINIGKEYLSFIHNNLLKIKTDLILIKGETGNLYKEIFTHYGSGTLITNKKVLTLRKAKTTDVLDIFMLMKPNIRKGLILPIEIEKLTKEIDSFYVLTSEQAIVACAKLNSYAEAYEFAKFSTLPRYQGKGKGKSLAIQLLQVAKKHKKKYCFALTIDPKVGEFFKQLGFKEVSRKLLPQKWKENYDFSRPSKAYKFDL